MLSEQSAEALPFEIVMIGEDGKESFCKLNRPYLETGYFPCESPIEGQTLRLTIFNDLVTP